MNTGGSIMAQQIHVVDSEGTDISQGKQEALKASLAKIEDAAASGDLISWSSAEEFLRFEQLCLSFVGTENATATMLTPRAQSGLYAIPESLVRVAKQMQEKVAPPRSFFNLPLLTCLKVVSGVFSPSRHGFGFRFLAPCLQKTPTLREWEDDPGCRRLELNEFSFEALDAFLLKMMQATEFTPTIFLSEAYFCGGRSQDEAYRSHQGLYSGILG